MSMTSPALPALLNYVRLSGFHTLFFNELEVLVQEFKSKATKSRERQCEYIVLYIMINHHHACVVCCIVFFHSIIFN